MPTTPYGLVRAAGPVHRATKREPVDQWVVVVPGSDPVVLAATDLHADDGADADRAFTVGVSRDPLVVASCGRLLGI